MGCGEGNTFSRHDTGPHHVPEFPTASYRPPDLPGGTALVAVRGWLCRFNPYIWCTLPSEDAPRLLRRDSSGLICVSSVDEIKAAHHSFHNLF